AQSISFECLQNKKWDKALLMYEELFTCRHSKELSIQMYNLNILLCKKYLNYKNITKNIEDLDCSAMDDFLKMGAYALKNDSEKCIETIKKLPDRHRLSKVQYETWPIFIEIRKNHETSNSIIEICNEHKTKKKIKRKLINIDKIKMLDTDNQT